MSFESSSSSCFSAPNIRAPLSEEFFKSTEFNHVIELEEIHKVIVIDFFIRFLIRHCSSKFICVCIMFLQFKQVIMWKKSSYVQIYTMVLFELQGLDQGDQRSVNNDGGVEGVTNLFQSKYFFKRKVQRHPR